MMRDSGWTKGAGIVLMLVGIAAGSSGAGWYALALVGFVLFLSGRLAEG